MAIDVSHRIHRMDAQILCEGTGRNKEGHKGDKAFHNRVLNYLGFKGTTLTGNHTEGARQKRILRTFRSCLTPEKAFFLLSTKHL